MSIEPDPLPGMDAQLNALDDAQIRAAKVRRIFEASEDYAPWLEDYWALLAEGWSWRQAVYMLWASQPRDKRIPKTQHELATQVLGLSSDRQIRAWREKNPAMDARIARLAASTLAKHRAEIYAALVAAASNPDPRAHSDRKLALELMGDYTPRQRVDVGQILPDELEHAETEDLAALAQIPVLEVEDGSDGDGQQQGDEQSGTGASGVGSPDIGAS